MENLHIYLRVSTDTQQTDGFGLENQKEVGLRVCEKLGMNPIIHNEGSKSSSSENIEDRPILNDLMFKINDGEVKNIWVFNNDRLSRNENVWNTIRLTLRKNECKLYVGEGTEYQLENMMDDFIFGIMSEVTKYDNRVRTDRLRRGKLSKIKNGGWKGGPPPYGYEIKDGKLIPQSYEKRWIRKIYEEYSNGSSIYQIRKLLMKNGVESRRGNVIWSERSVRVVLENTVYEGFYLFTDKQLKETVRCVSPKIVPISTVKKVRKRLSEQTYRSNYEKYETLLRDFLVCSHCGSKFGQRVSKTQYKSHYFCRGNTERLRNGELEKICVGDGFRIRSLKIEDTDKLVWDLVVKTLEKSHIFKEVFKKDTMKDKMTFGQQKFETIRIQKKIKSNEKTIIDIEDTINSNLVDGILDKQNEENFKSIIRKFEEKKRDLLSEIEDLKSQHYQLETTTKWINWIEEFKDRISDLRNTELSVEEKKRFLEGIVDKIFVTTLDKQKHRLDIRFKSPYVNDGFEWNLKGKPNKGYKVINGSKSLQTDFVSDGRTKKKILEII